MPNGEHSINLSELSEADICRMFSTPAIKVAGWNLKRQVRDASGECPKCDGKMAIDESVPSTLWD